MHALLFIDLRYSCLTERFYLSFSISSQRHKAYVKVAPYGFDCVEHNHVQKFIIFSSFKMRSQNSAT